MLQVVLIQQITIITWLVAVIHSVTLFNECASDQLWMGRLATNLTVNSAINWNLQQPANMCTAWQGVICGSCSTNTTSTCCVTQIRVSGLLKPISSTLQPVSLDEIGEAVSHLHSLQKMDLSNNHLTGKLPILWSQLSRLEGVALFNNYVSGPLPSSWGSLTSLKHLYLASNYLSGSIPASWGNLINLSVLSLSNNNLNGQLPVEVKNLVHLQQVGFDQNQFNGTLPKEWSTLINLVQVYLSSNQISGSLPPTWSSMTQLQELYLDDNNFNGQLPVEWSSMTQLGILYLNNNTLSGPLPIAWKSMVNLQKLYLHFNLYISGELPSAWSSMVSLEQLTLEGNSITGSLPVSWMLLTNLQALTTAANQLTGTIPEEWNALVNLQRLDLSRNQFRGTIPQTWGNNLTSLQVLDLSSNILTGKLPTPWSNYIMLQKLFLNDNTLTLNDRNLFTNLPMDLIIMDVSGKSQHLVNSKDGSNLLSVNSLEASEQNKMQHLAIVKMEGVDITCPLPDSIVLQDSHILLITSACKPPLKQLIVPSIVLASCVFVCTLVWLFSEEAREMLFTCKNHPSWKKVLWIILIVLSIYDFVTQVIAYRSMAVSLGRQSRDKENCQVVNQPPVFKLYLPVQFQNIEIFNDGSIINTIFPDRSNLNPQIYSGNTSDFHDVSYTTFAEYLALVRAGWPSYVYSGSSSGGGGVLDQTVGAIKQTCETFIVYKDSITGESTQICGYHLDSNSCDLFVDVSSHVTSIFKPFFYASLVVFIAKEMIKLFLVCILLCGKTISTGWKKVIRASISIPLLAIFCKEGDLQEIFDSSDLKKSKDVLFSILFEGLSSLVLQPALAFYYTFYISQQGLELGVILSLFNTAMYLLWLLYNTVMLYLAERILDDSRRRKNRILAKPLGSIGNTASMKAAAATAEEDMLKIGLSRPRVAPPSKPIGHAVSHADAGEGGTAIAMGDLSNTGGSSSGSLLAKRLAFTQKPSTPPPSKPSTKP